jgi:hypothetical protein
MELKLPNGLTISGSEVEVSRLAASLGFSHLVAKENDGVHYRSSTHGLMRIKDMNTRHVINAIRKLYRAEADALPVDRVTLVQTLRSGVGAKNVTLLALINELQTRRD